MGKISFWAYCKANPMGFVALAFIIGIGIAGLVSGGPGGRFTAIFMGFVLGVLIWKTISSYREL